MRMKLLPLVLLAGCTSATGDPWARTTGKKVVASFAPVQCFALNVAGPDAAVKGIMTTQGPHDFQPGPADARVLTGADLLFLNGLGLDDTRMKQLVAGVGSTKLTVVTLGAKLPDAMLVEGECHHADHAGHEHGKDPHIWTGLAQAELMVAGIRDELKKADPDHAAGYDARAAEFTAKLKQLKTDGDKLLEGKKDRKFVCFHESMNYFAKSFDLTVAAVIEDVPGHAPTPKQLEEIVQACVKNNVRVIAVEPQYSAKSAAEQIVAELKRRGVTDPVVITLDPLETATADEINAGWYETKMRANLAALAGALK